MMWISRVSKIGFPANFLDNSAAIHQLRYLSLASDKEIVKTHKSECKSSETLQSRAGAGEKQGLLNKIAPIKIIMRGPAAVKETYLKIKGKYDAKMSDDDFRTKAHFIFLFFGPISPAMPMYAFCYMLTLPTSHPLAVW
ncbi:hypothetical protein GIB67_013311 [Kingdonia uniflora]|uniref:Uncharacterized protein n=1 Tax=Kingdonia uniflora TaxID=39325 RepID=A0A7J7LQY7_9MAGN|nr:hypothetical protein GIB67_013311 [Kingdonia uniflora]